MVRSKDVSFKRSFSKREWTKSNTFSSMWSEQDIKKVKIKAEFIAHHDQKFETIRKLDDISNEDLASSFTP